MTGKCDILGVFRGDPTALAGVENTVQTRWHRRLLRQGLAVSNRVDQVTLYHVFKMHNNLAPKYMSEHFSPASNAHSCITRFRVSVNQSGELCSDTKRYSLPGVKGFGQKTFAYQGCYLWNSLPQFVRNSKNV